MAYDNPDDNVPLWKVVITDIAGVGCLALVPFLGPLPGPGGIPLIIAGLGLLARNHVWAQNLLHYVKKHSDTLRQEIFPNKKWPKRAWDTIALTMLVTGTWASFVYDDNRVIKVLAIGVMAGASTVFMMNRNRITKLDNFLRKKNK